jgi:hypothetical protein
MNTSKIAEVTANEDYITRFIYHYTFMKEGLQISQVHHPSLNTANLPQQMTLAPAVLQHETGL